MDNNYATITEAFEKAGVEIATAEYSLTEYSLNTDLSFRFDNLKEFLAFLEVNRPGEEQKAEDISNLLISSAVNPDSFFYVNFYKPKVAEL
ncbi:MAG: hypothetical protein EOO45_32055 [Flavobacterium sp.]|nr:MAG: hypothetical protein EOO45_32055 [Flavobacterium sp.]